MVAVTVASFGVGAAVATAPTYNTEMSPPAARGRLLLGGQVVAFAMLNFVGVVPALLLLPEHPEAYILLLALMPVVIMIPLILKFVPESPRWLEGKGRHEEADRLVSRMEAAARARYGELAAPDPGDYKVPVTERVPVSEVFRGVYLRRTVLLLAVWLLVYAGLDYGMGPYIGVYVVDNGFTSDDLFTMTLIGGLGSILIVLFGSFLGERVERKDLMFGSGLCICVGAALMFAFPHSYVMLVLAQLFTHAGSAGFLANMYNYTATAYPTRVRAVGVGWTDGVGHLGAVFGPMIAGVFYSATAVGGHWGWFAWFALPGALLPGLLMFTMGIKQRSAALERLSR